MHSGTFQRLMVPPQKSKIMFGVTARQVHDKVVWDLSCFYQTAPETFAPFAQAAVVLPPGVEPVVLGHLAAEIAVRGQYVPLGQQPPPGTVLPDNKGGELAKAPQLTALAAQHLPEQGSTLAEAIVTIQGFLQGGALAAGGAGKPVTKEALVAAKVPEGLHVGPDKSGRYRMACGSQSNELGWSLGGACLNGGPCAHTSTKRCWRWKGAGAPPAAVEGDAVAEGDVVDAGDAATEEAPKVAAPAAKVPQKKAVAKAVPKPKKTKGPSGWKRLGDTQWSKAAKVAGVSVNLVVRDCTRGWEGKVAPAEPVEPSVAAALGRVDASEATPQATATALYQITKAVLAAAVA